MVVSGLPEPLESPPPGYYAGEIAKFSLELMKNVKSELDKMDPNSDDVLWLKNLRIGFHSGWQPNKFKQNKSCFQGAWLPEWSARKCRDIASSGTQLILPAE